MSMLNRKGAYGNITPQRRSQSKSTENRCSRSNTSAQIEEALRTSLLAEKRISTSTASTASTEHSSRRTSTSTNFEALFGLELQTKEGMKKTNEVLNGKKAVLIYFSAQWCPPKRDFTPSLVKAYLGYDLSCPEMPVLTRDIEVVFASNDRDQASFDEYYGNMPWTALPFSNQKALDELAAEFGPQSIPMLVVLKGDGTVVTDKGRHDLDNSSNLNKALMYWGV